MNNLSNETFAESTDQSSNTTRAARFPGWLRGTVAYVLVLALIGASLPARVEAAWQDKSGSLPGTISGKEAAAIIAGGAAVAGLVVYLVVKKKRKQSKATASAPPAKADNLVPGRTRGFQRKGNIGPVVFWQNCEQSRP